MRVNTTEVMTQEELVEKLRQVGYDDASVTRIAHWRKLDLLPQFSIAGHGRGRGVGRFKAFWSNPTEVISQAVAILDLQHNYRQLEELYLPLWQMGFAIPLQRVRSALLSPLVGAAIPYEVQEDGRTTLEDEIDEGVSKIAPFVQQQGPLFDVPEDTLAAVMNVMVNPDYAFWDQAYEDGVSELKEWEHSFFQRFQKILGDNTTINPEAIGDDNNIFTHAHFINRHLSLPCLIAAVQDCSDDELTVVQRDLHLGREILLVFKRLVEFVTPFLPDVFRFSPNDCIVIFNVGTLLVWCDLALRRNGFGSLIDQLIPQILDQLHHEFDETTEHEIQKVGPELGKALQMVEQLMVTEFSASIPQG